MLIPTNVITGFLGVGKTTAVLDLLARKPADEHWAVLVNEYGEVSIDHAILEGGGSPSISVREVAGGCICCATAPYLQVALHLLLLEAKPQRLIVETTGLGHPRRLLELLRGEAYRDRLDVRGTLTLISPDDFTTPGMLANPIFQEQVELADVLVLNKVDRASAETVAAFQQWANALEPEKQLVVATQEGRLEREWLDVGERPEVRLPQVPESDTAEDLWRDVAVKTEELPRPGVPIRKLSANAACGWIFSLDDIFDEHKITELLLLQKQITRGKGVFRTRSGFVIINLVGGRVTSQPTTYARDSRVELFSSEAVTNWVSLESQLLNCRQSRTESW